MLFQTESKAQGWRAVAVLDGTVEALLFVGRSSTQVRAGYAEAFADVLDDEGKDRVTAIRLQQWQGAPDAGKWLDKAELREAVRQAIESLGERQRMAVLLSKFEHFSYAEIGEIMDLTPEAVKSLLSRARCRLREVLEPYITRGLSVEGQEPELADSGPHPSSTRDA